MSDSPSEHTRFKQYLRDLEHVADHSELAVVGAVLHDPDQTMAVSAVLQHINRRAGGLDGDQLAAWARSMTALFDGHDLLLRRLRDWTTLKAINAGQPLDAVALTDATNWLQQAVAETTTSSAALTILAESGRTRRIRNTATTRARRPSR